jgi:hypothetical protein
MRLEESVIDPAPLDEEQKTALRLHAEALDGHRNESVLIDGEFGSQ